MAVVGNRAPIGFTLHIFHENLLNLTTIQSDLILRGFQVRDAALWLKQQDGQRRRRAVVVRFGGRGAVHDADHQAAHRQGGPGRPLRRGRQGRRRLPRRAPRHAGRRRGEAARGRERARRRSERVRQREEDGRSVHAERGGARRAAEPGAGAPLPRRHRRRLPVPRSAPTRPAVCCSSVAALSGGGGAAAARPSGLPVFVHPAADSHAVSEGGVPALRRGDVGHDLPLFDLSRCRPDWQRVRAGRGDVHRHGRPHLHAHVQHLQHRAAQQARRRGPLRARGEDGQDRVPRGFGDSEGIIAVQDSVDRCLPEQEEEGARRRQAPQVRRQERRRPSN